MNRPDQRPSTSGARAGSSVRVRLFAVVSALSGIGILLCGWMLFRSDSGAQAAQRMGMSRVAERWDDILSILAVPSLVLLMVLFVWSINELQKVYRANNDPRHHRRLQREARRAARQRRR